MRRSSRRPAQRLTGGSLRDGQWVRCGARLQRREAYLHGLELIRERDYDVLVPRAATADGALLLRDEPRRRRVDAILERNRRRDDR